MPILPGYRERQDAQVALQAKMQIEYSEKRNDELARGRQPNQNPEAKKLGEALDFISLAALNKPLRDTDGHCQLVDGWALMTNGQLFAGHPIEVNLGCCPHLEQLRTAMAKCGKTLSTTLLGYKLSVKGDKLTVKIPCMSFDPMPDVEPDPPIVPINDEIKAAFKSCAVLSDENATDPLEASLLLETNTCSSTDRKAAIQYWHGNNIPPGLVIPKVFAAAVVKQTAKLVSFGWTEGRSITFYFDNGAWLKTLLYADPWPDMNAVLDVANFPDAIPDGLFEACDILTKFSDDNTAFFLNGCVSTENNTQEGANYEVVGLVGGKHVNLKHIKAFATFAKQIDYQTHSDRIMFFGDMERGCAMTMKPSSEG